MYFFAGSTFEAARLPWDGSMVPSPCRAFPTKQGNVLRVAVTRSVRLGSFQLPRIRWVSCSADGWDPRGCRATRPGHAALQHEDEQTVRFYVHAMDSRRSGARPARRLYRAREGPVRAVPISFGHRPDWAAIGR